LSKDCPEQSEKTDKNETNNDVEDPAEVEALLEGGQERHESEKDAADVGLPTAHKKTKKRVVKF
jgi:hypothetical protein